MLHRFRLPAFLAAAALLAGCFHIDTVLMVRPDGSAELRETVSAGGMFGVIIHKAALDASPGEDRSSTYGDGVTVQSVEHAAAPGRATVVTVYDVPDVSALRYDLSDAFDFGAMIGEAMSGDLGDSMALEDASKVDTTSFRFAFTPGTGGDAAQLRVTVPAVSGFPETDTPLGMLGGGTAPSEDEDTSLEEVLVAMGDARMRFSVRAAGIVDADAGWTEGDQVTLTAIDMGTFLEHLIETGATVESFGTQNPALGFDLPGYRVAPTGTTTIQLR